LLDLVKLPVEVRQFPRQSPQSACDVCATLLKQRTLLFAADVVLRVCLHGGRSLVCL
jgi:hypothetical protein